tara:strand:+ start:1052 stop:1999 length:948 start_codon:yes stop_codon:yes gene_type:complete
MKNLTYIFLAMLFMSQYTIAQVPSYVPSDGLVGYWPFDGNANDESDNGNNGNVNGAVSTNDRFNNENSAYYFDGINDYIIASPLALVNEVVSISLWIKNDNNSGEWNGIITTQPDTSQGFLLQENQNDKYDWTVATGTSYVDLFSNSSISSQWDHFVCIISDDLMSIYINGVLDATQSVGSYSLYSTADLRIGSRFIDGEFFKGKLDDIGIWNRSLTEQEITNLYDSEVLSSNTATYENNINIYPNPANDHIAIDFGNLDNVEDWNIKIINILGQEVLSHPINTDKINVSELSKGVYYIKISDGMSQIDRKFIKN